MNESARDGTIDTLRHRVIDAEREVRDLRSCLNDQVALKEQAQQRERAAVAAREAAEQRLDASQRSFEALGREHRHLTRDKADAIRKWAAAEEREASLRAKLKDIASREWRDEGGRIAAAVARDALAEAAPSDTGKDINPAATRDCDGYPLLADDDPGNEIKHGGMG